MEPFAGDHEAGIGQLLVELAHLGQELLIRHLAGFWIWQVKSMDEAVAWARKCPNPTGEESELEIRPVFEAEDFGAEFTPELREQEDRIRAKAATQTK